MQEQADDKLQAKKLPIILRELSEVGSKKARPPLTGVEQKDDASSQK
jgi:hypothetical protein